MSRGGWAKALLLAAAAVVVFFLWQQDPGGFCRIG